MKKEKEVFTPKNASQSIRYKFDMKDVEVLTGSLDVRGKGKKAVVKIKGKTYDVIGIPCDLPNCMCDAYIKELPMRDKKNKVRVVTLLEDGSMKTDMYQNFTSALKDYPTLDMHKDTSDFTGALADGNDDKGVPIMRFEDWKVYKMLSR